MNMFGGMVSVLTDGNIEKVKITSINLKFYSCGKFRRVEVG